MNKFDEGPNYCMKCKKDVVKPCFFILETDECMRLQEALKTAKRDTAIFNGEENNE